MVLKPTGGEPNNLAVSLQGLLFNKGDHARLVDVLAECERTTDEVFIDADDQLALSRRAMTTSGDKISWLAMRQICKILSSGLASSLSDLLGMRRVPADMDRPSKIKADPDEDFTVGEAASLYNLALKKRFGRLYGFQAIRNSDTKVIEAVVGSRYRRLPNGDFLSAVSSVIDSCEAVLKFHSASVAGRRLSLVYAAEGFEDSPLTPGIRLVNSEIGDSAIKAAVVLMDSNGATMMSAYGKLGRVAHSGRDLLGKLSQLIVSVSSKLAHASLSKDGLAKKINNMSDRKLGFKGDESDDARFQEMIEFLADRVGLTYFMARRCLSMTLAGNENQAQQFAMLERAKVWPSKSMMHLISAIMIESLNQRVISFGVTDRAERVAWNLFSNKVSFPDIGSGE